MNVHFNAKYLCSGSRFNTSSSLSFFLRGIQTCLKQCKIQSPPLRSLELFFVIEMNFQIYSLFSTLLKPFFFSRDINFPAQNLTLWVTFYNVQYYGHNIFTIILRWQVFISSHLDGPTTYYILLFTIHNLIHWYCCENVVFLALLFYNWDGPFIISSLPSWIIVPKGWRWRGAI